MKKFKKNFINFMFGDTFDAFVMRILYFILFLVFTVIFKFIINNIGLITFLGWSLVVIMLWIAASYIVNIIEGIIEGDDT